MNKHLRLLMIVPLLFIIQCGKSIPTVAPAVPTSPEALFESLRYVAVRKDLKYLKTIQATYSNIVFSNAYWCHYMAKSTGIQLTSEEITELGATQLAADFDNFNSGTLPQQERDNYNLDAAAISFQAGLYRLTKGFNNGAWEKMRIISKQETVQAGRPLVQLGLGLEKDKTLLVLSCMPLPGKDEKRPWVIVTLQLTVNKNGLIL